MITGGFQIKKFGAQYLSVVNLCVSGPSHPIMTPIDFIYITCLKWYDRDAPFMKKANAPFRSALFLCIIISFWLMLIAFSILNLYSLPLPSSSRNIIITGEVVIWILCYLFYVDNGRGARLYNSKKADKIKTFSRAKLISYLLFLSLCPFALMIIEAIFWKHAR